MDRATTARKQRCDTACDDESHSIGGKFGKQRFRSNGSRVFHAQNLLVATVGTKPCVDIVC
jgi:hypothetical protein